MARPRILIVEDEGITLAALRRMVKGFGYSVAGTAVNGEEAVSRAQALRPDLVLMDIVLGPGMDGIEAARRIRRDYGVPTVFLTAYSDEKMLRRGTKVDALGYVVKPVRERGLQAALEVSLYRHRIERERERLLRRLERALARIKLLTGLLPICASCKKIRDDLGNWRRLEHYIEEKTDAQFTHGICPECRKKMYPGL